MSLRGRFVAAALGIAAPLCFVAGVAHAENFSDSSVAGYWVNSTFDSSGNEGVNAFGAPTVTGGQLVSTIPTDATNWPEADGGGQGYEAVEHVAVSAGQAGASTYYNGSLLGDLTGKATLTATFNLTNSTITSGAPFSAGEFGGETGASAPGIRLYFKNSNYDDPESPEYGISEWWFTPSPALVTALSNGTNATLTADLTTPADWTDIDGHSGDTEPAAFEEALSGVTSLGLSLGSGDYYSDGFGFNTGGTGALNLVSINTTPTPEPASLSLLSVGGLMFLRRRRNAMRNR